MKQDELISVLIRRKWFEVISLIFMLGITLLVYWPSFKAPFHFDDLEAIVNNHYIRITELSWASFKSSAFQDFKHNRPLSNFSLALNYYFNQLNPLGYHLVNFFFFLFTGIGIRLTLGKFFRQLNFEASICKLIGWLITFFWLSHPLNTQAVTYIVQRHTSMAGAFSIWSLYFFQLGKEGSRKRNIFFFFAGLSCVLALLSKETSISLPLIIFLFDLYFYQNLPPGWLKRNWRWLLGLGLFYLFSAGLMLRPGIIFKLSIDSGLQDFSLGQRILMTPSILLWYPFLILFPFPQFLSLEHYFPFFGTGAELAGFLLGWAMMLGIILLSLIQGRRRKFFSFALLWYLGQLAIEALPLPIDLANEHRLYLAMLGIMVPLVGGLLLGKEKIIGKIFLLLLVGAFFSWFSYERNLVWSSRQSLWRDSVKKSPLLPRAWNNYCSALSESNQCGSAFKVCQKALSLNPDLADAHNALGICYFKAGKLEEAKREFQKASELGASNYSIPDFNLGLLYSLKRDEENALKWFQKALEKNPSDASAHFQLALIYYKLNQEGNYIQELVQALKLKPEWTEPRLKLAQALVDRGKCPEAIRLIKSAPAYDSRFEQIFRACP